MMNAVLGVKIPILMTSKWRGTEKLMEAILCLNNLLESVSGQQQQKFPRDETSNMEIWIATIATIYLSVTLLMAQGSKWLPKHWFLLAVTPRCRLTHFALNYHSNLQMASWFVSLFRGFIGFEAGPICCRYASPRTQMLRFFPLLKGNNTHLCRHIPQ